MDALERDYADVLLADHDPPCLSLYMPTHRHWPDRAQDPIRFRNLTDRLEASLRREHPARDAHALLERFRTLADESPFWHRTLDGLAVLATADIFKVYRLQRPVPELAVVADTFHTKPLLRILQSADRYQVLALSRQDVKMFEGNRDVLDEIELTPGLGSAVEEAGRQDGEPERRARVYGGSSNAGTTRHGTDLRQQAANVAAERFFRAVDQEVLETYSRPSRMPLLLAALPANQHAFRAISRNPFLAAEAIDAAPESLTSEALRERAWELVLPRYLARLEGLVDRYRSRQGTGLAAANLDEIAAAVAVGRVELLLIEADRHIPGVIADGKLAAADLDDPQVDDALDDLGALVQKSGGEVVVVPRERMPSDTGAAAVYRF